MTILSNTVEKMSSYTTNSDIKQVLELFLLNYGIKPEFFESEYNKYFEDAVFGNPELDDFKPDLVFVHTTTRNIARFPSVTDSPEQIDALLEETMGRFEQVWKALATAILRTSTAG